jgi:hypothetical protein
MSAKAHAVASELKDALAKRFAAVSLSFDTDGAPLIRIGSNAAAGQQTALIKVADVAPLGTDAIGLSARGYTPCVAQLVLETSTISNVALLVEASKLAIMAELGHRGLKTELYMSANTNATGPEDITSGNLKATFDPDPKWKSMSSI